MLYRELGELNYEAGTLIEIGDGAYAQHRYTDASQSYQPALALVRQLGSRDAEALVLYDIGRAQERQGRYSDASASYRQAQQLGKTSVAAEVDQSAERVQALMTPAAATPAPQESKSSS